MGADLILAGNILIPCAATQPAHAVRKSEFDELAAALDALSCRVTVLEPTTGLDSPVINGYSYNKGTLSVDFSASVNATRYRLEVVVYPSGIALHTDFNYVSATPIVLNKEGLEGESCRASVVAIRDDLESQPSYTEYFTL